MKKTNNYLMLFFILAALIPAALPEPVQAQGSYLTEEIQPDGTSGYDSYLSFANPTTNYGTGETMIVGETATDTARGVIRWDLSTLPQDAKVISASLSLWVAEDLASSSSTLQVFALERDWSEAWVNFDQYADTVEWQLAGAEGADDRLDVPSGEVALAADLTPGTRVDITLTPEDVGNLIRENYYGFLIRTESEADDGYSFYTSDYTTDATKRPMLTIEYDPDPPVIDPGWWCVEGIDDCSPLTEGVVISPFISDKANTNPTSVTFSYGGGWEGYDEQIGARLNCEPYPNCKNDYPIYYSFTYHIHYEAGAYPGWIPGMVMYSTITLPGGDNANQDTIECTREPVNGGWNVIGDCDGLFSGIILPEQIPTLAEDMDVGLKMQGAINGSAIVTEKTWSLFLSITPPMGTCSDTYMVPTIDTYTIDPILETPLGMIGDEPPSDEQGYPTVIGSMYMVSVQDGPWNDGTSERSDTAVSTDGTTYQTLEDFSFGGDVVCVDVNPFNDKLLTVYFTATSETFFIRVNDVAGNVPSDFADNTNDVETPLNYSIGVAFLLPEAVTCESYFTYSGADTISSVSVHSNVNDTRVDNTTEPIEPGGWYGIEVAFGTWNEDTPTTPRIDMEFEFSVPGLPVGHNTDIISPITEWEDLATGSPLVYCVSSDSMIVFIQAPMETDKEMMLHLRVNDQDDPNIFGDNTGTLGVNIYHATFSHPITGCELQYNIGDLVDSDTVDGGASNGQAFGNSLLVTTLSTSYQMTPGGWYVLETKDGPWTAGTSSGLYVSGNDYYDITLKDGNDWDIPANWPLTACAVTIDALGHQRVYFQVPNNAEDGGLEFFLRVAAPGFLTGGSMGWNLYEAVDIAPPGGTIDGCSDFIYDPNVATGMGDIDSTLANGDHINGLEVNTYRAVQIESANEASDAPYFQKSGWFEDGEATESDDLQLTVDGSTWADLPNHPAVLCYYYTPVENELVFIFQVLNGQVWKMRADSETFGDNNGIEIYRTYAVTAGDTLDPWTSCSDEYTATVPAINEHEWIPPQDEEGVNLMPTLTYTPGADPNGDGIILWGDPGLAAGHDYMVETLDGPWKDGDSPVSLYTAQLSSDGGTTWYLFGEHPGVICYAEDQLGWYSKAIFHVDEGEIWKIRVADTETDVFTDNTGRLAYRLNLVNEFPIEGPGDYATDYDPSAFDVCSQSLVRPASLTLSEIGSLGNYFGDWIHYINRSLMSYMAWCPRHTEMLLAAVNALKTKEPLATVDELGTVEKNVMADVASYDWEGGGFQDTSIFSSGSEDVLENILPTAGESFEVWDGGELVVFDGDTSLPDYYYTCGSVFADYLPSRLRDGVCFASAYWKETGMSFWIQLIFDLMSIFLLFKIIKGAAQSLIYMMTGVRPWTKDGAITVIETAAQGGNIIQPVENWRTKR